ncbi:MAG: M15 family metallopeptidase [Bacteroidales bacterium]|nr:M15 family metallopeptidase [Bacteroidales bacterium]
MNKRRLLNVIASLALCVLAFSCQNKENTNVTEEETVVKEEATSVEPAADTTVSEALKNGFVVVTDVVPDAILEIRYFSTFNFMGVRVDGYNAPIAYLTKEAADSLKAVSDDVKAMGYRLKIYDAYRPQCAVDHFVRWSQEAADTLMKRYFYPDIDKPRLFEEGYIAKKSRHTCGSTIDLTLFDMNTEKEVDMGSPFDWLGEESHPDYPGVTPEQHKNRMILRDAMVRHGFRGISTEWWHFVLKNEPYPNTYFTFPIE